MENIALLLKRLRTSKRHSGASDNIGLWKIVRQGIPYYLNRQGFALPPFTLFFTINGKCNLHCRMCDIGQKNKDSMFYQNLKGGGAHDFPIERFRSLMDEVKIFHPYIGITTTEPLLYPHIFDAVEYARSRGMNMNISTNGLLLEKYVREVIDSGLHRISVSLDGPAHIHDNMRGMPGLYDKVISGLRLLNEEKKKRGSKLPHVYIGTFICDTNHSHLLEFVENLPSEGIDNVNIKLMVFFTKEMALNHNRIFGNDLAATCSCMPNDFFAANLNVSRIVAQVKEIRRRFNNRCTFHFEPHKDKMEKYFFKPEEFMDSSRCVLPWFVAQINTKGDLLPLTRCYAATYGNIMDRPFLDVWNGQELRGFRRKLQKFGRFPGCARCDGVLYR